MQIISAAQRGNSPKNLLVERLAIALATVDESALDDLDDGIVSDRAVASLYEARRGSSTATTRRQHGGA